ncbi:MAG TPA: nitrogenase component 1 [Enhygromyxa sp.]|nr:nitrogenase component 1 [Enhygromyxa sp.]
MGISWTSDLFPELEDYASETPGARSPVRERDDVAPGVHHEQDVRIARPGLAAGIESLTRFERAFGLPGAIRSLKRTTGDEIELVIALAHGQLVAVSLVPLGAPVWRQGKSFGVAFRGPSLPTVVAKALLRFMARYDGVPFETILAQVVPDPGHEHMLHNDYPESVFYAFAPGSGWRRFFEGTELYRGTCEIHTGKVAMIEHTDIECAFNVVPPDNRLPGFFNTPRLDRDPYSTESPGRHMLTDVQDRDVVRGADKLLDQALESLADDPDKPELVFVQSGCISEVTGDDLEASVARTAAKLRLPVIVVGNQNNPVSAALGSLVRDREFAADRPLEAASVALLGMPDIVGRSSLGELLERAGISVLVSILPNLDRDALAQVERAELLVGYPWPRYRETARRLAERLSPARFVDLGAPFGVDGTARWLRAVGEALGRGDAIEAVLAEELASIGSSWRSLSARARRRRVGFVIEHPDWRAALAPSRSMGVPIVAMLREMGFGVDILAFNGAGAVEGDVRIDGFRSPAELEVKLREGDAAIWYSEMLYERRLTRTGKTPFSLRQFRMGLRGAVDTLAELVRLAELPFYRRYHAYLGSAFSELE